MKKTENNKFKLIELDSGSLVLDVKDDFTTSELMNFFNGVL